MPRGTTPTLLLFALLAVATALLPDARLRLVPRPAELPGRLAAALPGEAPALVAVRWPEAGPPAPQALPLVRPATAARPLVPVTPVPPRPAYPDVPDDPRLLRNVARAKGLGARELPVEEPCVDPPAPALAGEPGDGGTTGGACARGALDAFHLALRRAGAGSGFARVVHFGDSTISSDLIASTIRERLQARFGDGGRGYLFVDGPTRYKGQLRRAGRATPGWEIRSLAGPHADDGRYGMGGASFEARRAGERVAFAPRGSEVLDLHYLSQPGGGRLLLSADGAALGEVDTAAAEKAVQFTRFRLPPRTGEVTVRTAGPARIFGAVLERQEAGVVHDTLGVPGASADSVLSMDEADLAAALRRRRPDLLLVMLGMNESHGLKDTPAALAAFEEKERAMLARLRRAAPFASCLVTSPMDGGRRDASGAVRPKPVLPGLRDAQRRAALEAGCAFWDMFEAMGGAGSVARWHEAALALPDLSHPSDAGGTVLGWLLSDALLASHRAWLARAPEGDPVVAEPPGSPPGILAAGALGGWFDALATVEAKDAGARALALQLGDSHTAADKLPSQLRRRHAAAFGAAGRGLVFPGKPWRTPPPEDVVTSVAGFVTLEGLTGTAPPTFGPGGLLAAAAFPGDELALAPADGGPFAEVSAFEVHYLVDPKHGGRLELVLDGEPVETVDTARAPDGLEGRLGVARLEVFPGRHDLALRPVGDGEVAILGAALDADRPGVTWEALGLSGATAATPLAWDVELVHAQIARRRPRLVALAYGTNEAVAAAFDPAAYREAFGKLVGRVRGVAREASCLVIGPPDALVEADGALVPAPALPWIAGIQREVAAREGCAFWDARAAMGGEGSMRRWIDAGLALHDGVHLTPAGYRRLGDLLFEDLVAAFRARGEGR